jgi:hypothetical protein
MPSDPDNLRFTLTIRAEKRGIELTPNTWGLSSVQSGNFELTRRNLDVVQRLAFPNDRSSVSPYPGYVSTAFGTAVALTVAAHRPEGRRWPSQNPKRQF